MKYGSNQKPVWSCRGFIRKKVFKYTNSANKPAQNLLRAWSRVILTLNCNFFIFQIKTVVRSARRLVDAFQARHDTVESTLERLSDFNKSSDRLCDKLASVMDNVKARDEISGNAYELRKLQSELQVKMKVFVYILSEFKVLQEWLRCFYNVFFLYSIFMNGPVQPAELACDNFTLNFMRKHIFLVFYKFVITKVCFVLCSIVSPNCQPACWFVESVALRLPALISRAFYPFLIEQG